MLFLIFLRIAVEKRVSKKDCLCSLRQIVPEQVKRRINANDMTRFESGARETENDLRAEIRVAKRRGNGVWNGPGGRATRWERRRDGVRSARWADGYGILFAVDPSGFPEIG